MVFKPFDLEKYHPLYPRREILAEYEKVKFDYEKTVHDRAYEQWYALVKGRPVWQEVTQIYRKKITGEGEFLLYNLNLVGEDWKGNAQDFATLFGKYEKPIFRLDKNPETQTITTTQISSHKTVYDITYTKEMLDELLDKASEPVSMIVYGSAGRRLGVLSLEDYKAGSLEDLVMCANKGKSLETVLAEKGQFTYEKRERKPTAAAVVDAAAKTK